MNKTFTETIEFYQNFKKELKKFKKQNKELVKYIDNNTYGVAPSDCNLPANFTNKVSELKLCAQNVSSKEKGAFTGEVSPEMLKDLEVTYVICGHSERRIYHSQHENDEIINEKIRLCLKYNLTPIICIGETETEYEQKRTSEILKKQLTALLKNIDPSKVIIAYEPVWAIGTGNTPEPIEVEKKCQLIRELTNPKTPILYGGSVNEDNIYDFAKMKNINGFLVGNASLDINQFLNLISVHEK